MSEDRGERRPRPRGRKPRRKVCSFCVDKIEYIDYKDVNRLRRFVNERGKIMPRRMSGNCAKHQRQLSEAIKRAPCHRLDALFGGVICCQARVRTGRVLFFAVRCPSFFFRN